jgi:hypothetical protein
LAELDKLDERLTDDQQQTFEEALAPGPSYAGCRPPEFRASALASEPGR